MRYGPPAYGVSDHDNERLLWALVLSFVMHVAILATSLPQRPNSHVTGGVPMTVILQGKRQIPEASVSGVAPNESKTEVLRVLSQPKPSSFSLPTGQKTRPLSADHDQPKDAESTRAPGRASDAQVTPWGGESRNLRKPGEARVMLEVNADGSIGQIIWDLLPAMTDEQFNKLEAAIRARGRPGPSSNSFVRETIDVRDYIGTSP